MSKLQLKKELVNMEKDQLVELILDAYSARKETKEYLEFFVNPDVGKLQTKYEIAVSKELNRVKRGGYCKARISHIKKLVKEFSSFQPGFEAEMDLLFYTVSYAMAAESHLHFPETLMRGVASLVRILIDIADTNLVIDKTIIHLKAMFSNEQAGSRYFRRFLNDELASYMALSRPSHSPLAKS